MPSVSGFLPSTHAPLFRNGPWPAGLKLTIRVAGLPVLSLDATRWGLCGGMTFLTRDSVQAGQPQLCARDSSRIPLALAQHLRIPVKPDAYSKVKPDTHSDFIPDSVPI
ncbi:hypothetical protein [Microvirga calopogonii]|uniref:hypothetical protein n=1 Tax=Microvirga calopogonii TaxID=2078013 RepID=UPI000E0DFB86|nr:hypothetical protein [Microvirga calopogonii]